MFSTNGPICSTILWRKRSASLLPAWSEGPTRINLPFNASLNEKEVTIRDGNSLAGKQECKSSEGNPRTGCPKASNARTLVTRLGRREFRAKYQACAGTEKTAASNFENANTVLTAPTGNFLGGCSGSQEKTSSTFPFRNATRVFRGKYSAAISANNAPNAWSILTCACPRILATKALSARSLLSRTVR